MTSTVGIGLAESLAERRALTAAEYETFARLSAVGSPTPTGRAAFCHFVGIRDDKRMYERTGSLCC